MADREKPTANTHWLDDQKNRNKIWLGVIGLCAISIVADLFYHKHVKYAVEDVIPGMYGWYGLASCAVLVLIAKAFQIIVRRREDYYDEAEDD